LVVIDSEKGDAFFVETFSQVRMVIQMQFAFRVAPDLVQHSAKIEEAAHFLRGTAEGNRGHQMKFGRFPAWFKVRECLSSTDIFCVATPGILPGVSM
jgi:hypothetical protein